MTIVYLDCDTVFLFKRDRVEDINNFELDSNDVDLGSKFGEADDPFLAWRSYFADLHRSLVDEWKNCQ